MVAIKSIDQMLSKISILINTKQQDYSNFQQALQLLPQHCFCLT